MSAMTAADVPRETSDTFGGLLRAGETPEEALRRLEKTKSYTKTIGTNGFKMLAAGKPA